MNEQDIENDFTRKIYSSRDIRLASAIWLVYWPLVKKEFDEITGLSLELSCTYRSPQAQWDLYQYGRNKPGKKLTDKDGKTNLSKHNLFPSKAIDVWISCAGKAVWDSELFTHLGPIAKNHSLLWGGNWPGLKDMPHLEIVE